jgi:hypothetical protein
MPILDTLERGEKLQYKFLIKKRDEKRAKVKKARKNKYFKNLAIFCLLLFFFSFSVKISILFFCFSPLPLFNNFGAKF